MSPTEGCQQEFPDDAGIRDDGQMLRRIPPFHIVSDESLGRLRPSSAAFDDDRDGSPMSVYCRDTIELGGGNIERVMAGHDDGYALAGVTAGQFRSRDQTVHSDPLPDEIAHALVCGPKTDSNRKKFRQQAVWVIAPI